MSEKLKALEEQRPAILANYEGTQEMFKLIDNAVKTNKESNPGWVLAAKSLEEARAALEKLDKQIEDERQIAVASAAIKPLVEGFGTVTVKNTTNVPTSFHLVDVDKLLKEAQELVDRGQDRLKVYTAVKAAIQKANLPEDATIERPIHFVTKGNEVTISVATRGGPRRRTGTIRASGKVVRIVSCDSNPELVGRTVGSKEADYVSWREFLAKELPDEFARLEEGRVERNANYSAALVAERLLKLTTESVAA